MSTYDVSEIATLYGGLDDTASADGLGFDANMLRTIAMASNRLATAPHVLLAQAWPIYDVFPDGESGNSPSGGYVDAAYPWYSAVFAPVIVPKMAGATKMDIKILAWIGPGPEVWAQVSTLGSPFVSTARPGVQGNCVSMDTDSTWTVYTITDIPLASGTRERIGVYFRAEPTGTLVNTASVGAPNTVATGLPLFAPSFVAYPAATWNATQGTVDSLGEVGTLVRFIDPSTGNDAVEPRLAVSVDSTGTIIYITPEISLDDVLRLYAVQASLRLETMQQFSIANISAIARFV